MVSHGVTVMKRLSSSNGWAGNPAELLRNVLMSTKSTKSSSANWAFEIRRSLYSLAAHKKRLRI